MRDQRARWLYHLLREEDAPQGDVYSPASLARDGFIHASYAPLVLESARLYFPADAKLVVLAIDPRKLTCEVRDEDTPRGWMPHIFGAIVKAAIARVTPLAEFDPARDYMRDTRA